MLVMNADSDKADCLLGSYGMRQLRFTLWTADQVELLGQELEGEAKDLWPKVKAPVTLPLMDHASWFIAMLFCQLIGIRAIE